MSTRLRPLVLLWAATVFPGGCRGPRAAEEVSGKTVRWLEGSYAVEFRLGAGSPGAAGYQPSVYRICRRGLGGRQDAVEAVSAQSAQGFASVVDGDPRRHIRPIADPSGEVLVIEEDIPNDCGPCRNFLLVRTGVAGPLEVRYLQLPERGHGIMAAIRGEYPAVESVFAGGMVVRYAGTGPEVVWFRSLPWCDRPQWPG